MHRVLEAFALVTFLAYCVATGQARRAVISLLFLLVGGLVSVTMCSPLMQQAATLPVGDGSFLYEAPAVAWATQFALARTLAAGVWSGVPALIQWHR